MEAPVGELVKESGSREGKTGDQKYSGNNAVGDGVLRPNDLKRANQWLI